MSLNGKMKWYFLVFVTSVGLFIDWFTKYLASTRLEFAHPVDIIGKNLQLYLVYNKGMIFGINPANFIPGFPVDTFFYFFTALATILLIIYYANIKDNEKFTIVGVALVMPGALGNLLDRIIQPGRGVVDFIKVGISEKIYWPIWNIADAFITVGVILILLQVIFEENFNKSND